MAWSDLKGHELVKRIWQAHLAQDEVPNAYLLAGPEGVGKRGLAREMAKAMNCSGEERPCDACTSCAQIMKRLHPDVHWLRPEGASPMIKIDSVRQILGRIALRPFSGRYQVVIVERVERLTEEAANSLLKSLEEPPAHTRFLLTTSQPAGCLPTIVSRCHLIRCQRLALEVVEGLLVSSSACEAAAVPLIARLAGGSAGQALELAGRWPVYRRLVEQFGGDDPLAWFAAPLPESREEVEQLLDGMVAWLRDVLVGSLGDPAWVAHRMAEGPLRRQGARVDPDRCLETVWVLHRLRESLDQFVSPRLVASLAREHWLALWNVS